MTIPPTDPAQEIMHLEIYILLQSLTDTKNKGKTVFLVKKKTVQLLKLICC